MFPYPEGNNNPAHNARLGVPARSETSCMHGNVTYGSREILQPPGQIGSLGRVGKPEGVIR